MLNHDVYFFLVGGLLASKIHVVVFSPETAILDLSRNTNSRIYLSYITFSESSDCELAHCLSRSAFSTVQQNNWVISTNSRYQFLIPVKNTGCLNCRMLPKHTNDVSKVWQKPAYEICWFRPIILGFSLAPNIDFPYTPTVSSRLTCRTSPDR